MNKKFFEGMKTFASVLLILGFIGAFLIFVFGAFVQVETGSIYSRTKTVFNLAGFGAAIGCALISVVLYYFTKGFALIGLKLFANEKEPEENTSERANTTAVLAEKTEHLQKENSEKEEETARTRTIAIAVSCLVIIVLILLVVFGNNAL